MTFWERYCEECKKKNMSPSAVAQKFNLSRSMCTRWKNGSTPRIELLLKLSDFFGVDVEYLTGHESEEIPIEVLEDMYPGEIEDNRNSHYRLFGFMADMTDAELKELENYAMYILSKR